MKLSHFKNVRLWDILFVFVMITEFCASHSLLNNISLVLFCILSIIRCLEMKTLKTSIIFLFYAVLIFIGWLNIDLDNSISPANSHRLLTTLYIDLVFIVCAYQYMYHTDKEKLMKCALIAAILGSVYVLTVTFLITGTFILRGNGESTGINANALAVCNAFVVVCMLAKKKSWLQYTLILFLLLFCVLAGTRKALLVAIIGYVFFILLNNPSRIAKNVAIVTMTCCIAIWLIFNVPFLYDKIGVRFETLIDMMQGGKGAASEETRSRFIEAGMYKFNQRPMEGHGIGTFGTIYGTYSHNNYVELLFSLGIPGVVAYYSIHFYLAVIGILHYKKYRSYTFCLGIALLIAITTIDYAMVTYYERSGLILILIIASLLFVKKAK